MKYEPIVEELVQLIQRHKWTKAFTAAVHSAHESGIPEMADMRTIEDYLRFINGLVRWVPTENVQGRHVYDMLCKFYFVLDQPSVIGLQNAIRPEKDSRPLTPLSKWLVGFANSMGAFMDTPESLTPKSLATFYASPNYNLHEYVEPRGGWRTFNQFFARLFKPGYRPVAAIADQTVIVSPADSTFDGEYEIRRDSHVTTSKGFHYAVTELLEGSPYKDRFVNGQFMHAFLGPTDYHRQHAPVGGTVLEARVIPGQVYLQVIAEVDPNGRKALKPVREFDATNGVGYEFAQARGLIVLDTPIGLVAVVPIGMCQISSVVMTADVGVTLRKGEEISYFQFGGSDIILLFESKSNVSFTAKQNVHYKMGTRIAQAFPVL